MMYATSQEMLVNTLGKAISTLTEQLIKFI